MTFRVMIIFYVMTQLLACDSATTPTVDNNLRWMDRTLYFAASDPSNPNRNNFFQKQKVKEALDLLQKNSSLGEGYFSYNEVDESNLSTSLDIAQQSTQPQSFIVIWPDAVFNDYLVNTVNGNTPDQNAITVMNANNKRQFFIIIKASCVSFASGSSSACANIGSAGFNALIYRQLGLLVGMTTKDCNLAPGDIMCAASPSDQQFSQSSKLQFQSTFNNSLESIKINANYYRSL